MKDLILEISSRLKGKGSAFNQNSSRNSKQHISVQDPHFWTTTQEMKITKATFEDFNWSSFFWKEERVGRKF